MPKQPPADYWQCLLHTAAAMRSAHLDSRFRVMRRIKLEITLTRNNILNARNNSLDLLRKSPNLLRTDAGGPGGPVKSEKSERLQTSTTTTFWRLQNTKYMFFLQIFLERLQTSTTTTCRRLQNAAFCQNVVPMGATF